MENFFSMLNYRTWFTSFTLLHNFDKCPDTLSLVNPLVNPSEVKAATILKFSLRRLRMYYLPFEIFPSLGSSTRNYFQYITPDDVPGLSFICSGRITRRQMASCMRFQTGASSKGTIESPMDYAQGSVPLKYGVVGVKVYLTQNI